MKRAATLTLALSLGSFACGDSDSADSTAKLVTLAKSALARDEAPSAGDLPTLAAGNGAFAFDMLQQLTSSGAGTNLVFSPFSLSTALAMTHAAARGQTASEIAQTMHYELEGAALHEAFNAVDLALSSRGKQAVGADGTPFRLNVQNALWAQRDAPIVPDFLDVLALHYGTGVFITDFASDHEAARKAINAQVEERTEGLIPELLAPPMVTPRTRFVLTNTIYFNASWGTNFDARATTPAPFTRLDGSSADVPMMNATFSSVGVSFAEGEGYEAVALPYASDELAFIAVLPAAGKYASFESSLNAAWFAELRGKLALTSVRVSLPKFSYRTPVEVKEPLQQLGMQLPFTSDADFSGLSPGISISGVVHEAVIEVMETGTIAAAATAVVFGKKSADIVQPRVVRFDRPFLYAIVDKPTGQILFLGRVLDPSAS